MKKPILVTQPTLPNLDEFHASLKVIWESKWITNNGSFVILSTMKAFENELPSKKFLRIHKSYIINLKKVERYNSKFVEIENSQIPLSRNKKNTLTDALNVASSQKL